MPLFAVEGFVYECPENIYQYLSFEGVCKTLDSQTIRLSKCASFNDPFDTNLQAIFEKDTREVLDENRSAWLDFLEGQDSLPVISKPVLNQKALLIRSALDRATPEQRMRHLDQMRNIPVWEMYNLQEFERNRQRDLEFIRQSFESDGIFCSTVDNHNLLMWAHSAEQHHGAVIEFTPSVQKDSCFLASRKVTYTNQRPVWASECA